MAKMRMRVTSHNGRWGRSGAYTTKHNDRRFDVVEPHINANKSDDNWYWNCYDGFNKDDNGNTKNQFMTFDECEKKFYEENFTDFLNDRNSKYLKRRQYKNVWTADDYRTRKNNCPEETIFQIGRQGETIDPETLKNVFLQFKSWHEKEFPQVKILDFALHLDEATPHIQMRRVWVAEDENGRKCVSQTKALEKMCVKKPKEDKETHRWNNPKQTFTAKCREKFLNLCEEYGLEIEREPKEKTKVGLSLLEYQRQQEEKRLKNLQEQIEKMNTEIQNKENKLNEMEVGLKSIFETVEDYQNQWLNARQNKEYKKELQIVKEFLNWYNPDGRKAIEYFFGEVPKIAEKIKISKLQKNNNKGWSR